MPERIRTAVYRAIDTHLFLPALLFAWGVWMFAVDPVSYSASFSRFAVLPHTIWGAGIALAGLLALLLVRNSNATTTFRRYNLYAIAGMIITSSGYMFILTMLILGNWTSTGTVTYSFLLLLSLANLLEYLGFIYDSR